MRDVENGHSHFRTNALISAHWEANPPPATPPQPLLVPAARRRVADRAPPDDPHGARRRRAHRQGIGSVPSGPAPAMTTGRRLVITFVGGAKHTPLEPVL